MPSRTILPFLCAHLICRSPKLREFSQRVSDAITGDRYLEIPYCKQGQIESEEEDHIASAVPSEIIPPLLCVAISWLAGNGVTAVNDGDRGELDAI